MTWLPLGALCLGLLALVLRHAWRSFRHRARIRRGLALEGRAGALLEREGFTILHSQPRLAWQVLCDGEALRVPLRADYLVRRGGARWVVDVKSGQGADPRSIATRRQLLEYTLAYRASGALLVDMERGVLYRFHFGAATVAGTSRAPRHWWALVLLGAVLGLALGVWAAQWAHWSPGAVVR